MERKEGAHFLKSQILITLSLMLHADIRTCASRYKAPFTNVPIPQVGDSLDDMAAGFAAGCATVLLVAEGDENSSLREHAYTGRTISRLDDLVELLESGFVEMHSSLALTTSRK